jgi:D-tagatose-1,6-bisphosphate aldolase subunit GatZ/KbaZ
MKPLSQIIRHIIELRKNSNRSLTLLAVCPNSDAVLEAAIKTAADHRCVMLLAATLNQVDRDGGYTGWTPAAFMQKIHLYQKKYSWAGPVYPCLDHGGPWLKDLHTLNKYTLNETMDALKLSVTDFLQAGYQLLHIDPTVDRTIPVGKSPSVESIVSRTVELIAYSESERVRLNLPAISYEVGSEEVHGGLVNQAVFMEYLELLHRSLENTGLSGIWPCFIVAQVGTNLHTTTFDKNVSRTLTELVSPKGSLIKGHYTDWVANPQDYPSSGLGGANVGPEFTKIEFESLKKLENLENVNKSIPLRQRSNFIKTLETAVKESGRWQKWLLGDEQGKEFDQLSKDRKNWLTETGARYAWTKKEVVIARERLYLNCVAQIPEPNQWVVEAIEKGIEKYIHAFYLENSIDLFQ